MPTCAYRIGDYTVANPVGTLTWGADVTDAEDLLQALTVRGWDWDAVGQSRRRTREKVSLLLTNVERNSIIQAQ